MRRCVGRHVETAGAEQPALAGLEEEDADLAGARRLAVLAGGSEAAGGWGGHWSLS
jgi:hypothetical protein